MQQALTREIKTLKGLGQIKVTVKDNPSLSLQEVKHTPEVKTTPEVSQEAVEAIKATVMVQEIKKEDGPRAETGLNLKTDLGLK